MDVKNPNENKYYVIILLYYNFVSITRHVI
jgi:hypothetical protein